MKKWFLIISLVIFSVGCDRPKGFTLKKVTSLHAPVPEWESKPGMSRKKFAALMNQPFHYLGSGNHTYAFGSEDEQVVIKFFKQKHMKTKSWVDYLPLPLKRIFYPMGKIHRRIRERQDSFRSYKLAYEQLQKETGLLYLHLNKTDNLDLFLHLIDQNGHLLKISLDEMEFLVQQKALLSFHHLKSLYQAGRSNEAKEAIFSLFDLVAKRIQKGIYDKDLQFFKNFGFVGNQAIEVDVGEFRTDIPPNPTYDDLKLLSYQIRDFLKMHAPKHLSEVEDPLNIYIEQYK